VIAVIWTDWYAYHVARLRALAGHESLRGNVLGIELVGACGVHPGLRFRCEERTGLRIETLFPDKDWSGIPQPRLAMALWRKLRKADPSMVLVPGYYTVPALFAAAWAKLNGRRSVLMSETTREDHRRRWWKEMSKRFLIRLLFDSAIAGGKPHVRYLRELGLRTDAIRRAYDVVDNAFFIRESDDARGHANRLQSGLPEDYFLFVGRLSPEKNVSGLIASFAGYRASGGSSSLVICGDGPLRVELEDQARAAGLAAHIRFSGMRMARDLAAHYAFARCFVLPSTREPWGLVVNEAMASGLPVIVSKRCGCAEDLVEEGLNGYLFDPDRPAELTARLVTAGNLSQSALAGMGSRSREIVARYSPEVWASEVAQLASYCV
jgi:1,2-diacylglycerol 3-alpha-glucosyltransferase